VRETGKEARRRRGAVDPPPAARGAAISAVSSSARTNFMEGATDEPLFAGGRGAVSAGDARRWWWALPQRKQGCTGAAERLRPLVSGKELEKTADGRGLGTVASERERNSRCPRAASVRRLKRIN
jgi:hypothetical protein